MQPSGKMSAAATRPRPINRISHNILMRTRNAAGRISGKNSGQLLLNHVDLDILTPIGHSILNSTFTETDM